MKKLIVLFVVSFGIACASGSQGPGVRGHRHVVLGRYHQEEPVLLQPPQIRSRQKAPIKDDL